MSSLIFGASLLFWLLSHILPLHEGETPLSIEYSALVSSTRVRVLFLLIVRLILRGTKRTYLKYDNSLIKDTFRMKWKCDRRHSSDDDKIYSYQISCQIDYRCPNVLFSIPPNSVCEARTKLSGQSPGAAILDVR